MDEDEVVLQQPKGHGEEEQERPPDGAAAASPEAEGSGWFSAWPIANLSNVVQNTVCFSFSFLSGRYFTLADPCVVFCP